MFAITIGKFEALHRGHNFLINSTIEYARNFGLESAVMSFDPHPAQVLSDHGYKPLYPKREKELLIKSYDFDIDRWLLLPFDLDFASTSPQAFCHMLNEKFNCAALIVGEGFRFGRNREGTLQTLRGLQEFPDQCNQPHKIEVITIPLQQTGGKTISTSLIRNYLSKGQIEEANDMLGRPFFITGTVQKGRQLGRTMGFPTANVHPADDKFLPPDGVYASKITIGGKANAAGVFSFSKSHTTASPAFRSYAGVTNIGTNPTITGEIRRKVETHIFDFDEDIYDEEVIVELYGFIRPEQVFSGLEGLKQQIIKDAEMAAFYMSTRSNRL